MMDLASLQGRGRPRVTCAGGARQVLVSHSLVQSDRHRRRREKLLENTGAGSRHSMDDIFDYCMQFVIDQVVVVTVVSSS